LDRRLKGAFRKLSAALPAALKGDEQLGRQRVHIDNVGWEQTGGPTPHLLTLQQAVWRDNKLAIAYRSILGSCVGSLAAEIEPYGLVAKAGVWYLVAFWIDHIAVLRVEQILRARLSERKFERKPDFNLASFWQAWCIENQERRPRFAVTVRVSPDLRPYLSSVFGDSIAMEQEEAAEAVEAGWSMWQLIFSSFDEARGRILALGRAVEIIEPLSLRLSVIDFAQQIVGLYQENDLSKDLPI